MSVHFLFIVLLFSIRVIVWVLQSFIQGKKFKLHLLMAILITPFIVSCTSPAANENQIKAIKEKEIISYSDLINFDWGNTFITGLRNIGASKEDIEEIEVEVSNSKTMTFKVTLPKNRLWVCMDKPIDNYQWKLSWIKNYDEGIYYYLNDDEKFVGDKLLAEDIYSLKTGEVIEKVNKKEIKKYFDKLEKERAKEDAEYKKWKAEQEEKDLEVRRENFLEIYKEYQKNELSADDKYKGNIYALCGTFETVKDDGLMNTIFKEIGVVVKIKTSNKSYYLFCKFEDEEREALKKYSKGDRILFSGKCLGWGNWTECKVE